MNDDILKLCNETELLQMARRQGLGSLLRHLTRETLESIVSGRIEVEAYHLAGTDYTRRALERFIHDPANYERTRSQLPGCTGCCSSYPCSEGRHGMCFIPKASQVQ
jgi:hypothetical protein